MSFTELGPCIETIPNLFTPNNDGENDAFEIEGLVNSGLGPTLTVFNRWGDQVYFEEDYGNTWAPDEDELSEATYYIILDFSNYALPLEDIEHNGLITEVETGSAGTLHPATASNPDGAPRQPRGMPVRPSVGPRATGRSALSHLERSARACRRRLTCARARRSDVLHPCGRPTVEVAADAETVRSGGVCGSIDVG